MSKLHQAVMLATEAHLGQDRKYTGLPYISHPLEVMSIVQTVPDHTEDMLCAAVLHDVVEDTEICIEGIENLFGGSVATLVQQLTDHFSKEDYPNLNRRDRKHLEALRLSNASKDAQIIKCADLISNTRSIVKYDPGFAKTYLMEKRHILRCMPENPLWEQAWKLALQEIAA